MSTQDPSRASFERARDASTGQLLLKAARLWNERAIATVEREGGTLRAAHTRLLPHISHDGIRLVDLAARVGITKQAVGKLVDELEAEGLVERAPDPTDKRALLVRYTPRGSEALLHGLGVLAGIEAEVARAVGDIEMAELRRLLSLVVGALDQDTSGQEVE